MRPPSRYSLPEDQMRRLAIDRAASFVRDVVEVAQKAAPGFPIEANAGLIPLAHQALTDALARVYAEHRIVDEADNGLSSLASFLGLPSVRRVGPVPAPPAWPDPHPFVDLADSNTDPDARRMRPMDDQVHSCGACGQDAAALIHHPELCR